MVIFAPRHRFTVADYYKMAEAGILHEDDRVELIDGEIVEMAAIGPRHAACVARLTYVFGEGLRGRAIVWVQNPLHLGEYNEPEPDLVLARYRADFYASAHPGPEDALLVVEVADSSLLYDRTTKLPLYAQAGVPESWLVDLVHRRVHVHRDPARDGYRTVLTASGEDRLGPLALPDLVLTAAEILG
jgi:Uma2 family endonuclease